MSDVDGWMNEVCWAMGGTLAEQQTVRDELRAHIRDAARARELEGLTARDAIDAAVRDLGDATEVGRAMRTSRGSTPLRRTLSQPSGALLLDHRIPRQMPDVRIALAICALIAMGMTVTLLYVWP